MRHIANMVKEAECEVLVLQEVRQHADRSRSQADLLQRLLPGFSWVVTRLADRMTKPADSYWTGWEMEGLAVLSRWPLGMARAEKLSTAQGPDTNQRIALHVPVFLDPETTVNVLVVHLSYHRQQQCQNVAEILQYIDKNRLGNVVVAGDFNMYADFGDPIHLFQMGGRHIGDGRNQCPFSLLSPLSSSTPTFEDAWEAVHSDSPGFTFSNMPEPGLTSRPDRILISSSVRATEVSLHGRGVEYKTRHAADIFTHRLHRVMKAAKESLGQHAGFSCLHDCGPHGSCRCGVCVRAGVSTPPCHLPDCLECSSTVFMQLSFFFFLAAVLFLLAGTATVKILVVASSIDQGGDSLVHGFSCCLCNPDIVRKPTVTARHRAGSHTITATPSPSEPHHHSHTITATPSPSQPHNHSHTIIATPSPPHHHRHTITATPSQPHHNNHTITATPSQPHHHRHTITTTPSQPHHHSHTITITATPSQPHHHSHTTATPSHSHTITATSSQPQPHHHTITATATPSHSHTITATSSQPHHHSHTITATPHPHHHCHTITATPSQPHHIHTITATPSPPHHHSHTITATPSLPHHHRHTITATPSPPHHHSHTITAKPSQPHHHNPTITITITATPSPSQPHHHSHTITATPSQPHHHNHTITTTPSLSQPHHHHHSHTITATPSQPQPHHHSHTIATPSQPHHHSHTITTTPSQPHHHSHTEAQSVVVSEPKVHKELYHL
ncbi:hypothetical protein ACOMHN_011143 [Nucella lapillus]